MANLSQPQEQTFADQGYLVPLGALDPTRDIHHQGANILVQNLYIAFPMRQGVPTNTATPGAIKHK